MGHNADLFHCNSCSWGRHCDESKPAPIAKWRIKGVIESRTCLLPMITPQSHFLLRMFGHYKNRIMPNAGGILEQPNYYAEAMETLDAHARRIRAEDLERAQKNAARERHHLVHRA